MSNYYFMPGDEEDDKSQYVPPPPQRQQQPQPQPRYFPLYQKPLVVPYMQQQPQSQYTVPPTGIHHQQRYIPPPGMPQPPPPQRFMPPVGIDQGSSQQRYLDPQQLMQPMQRPMQPLLPSDVQQPGSTVPSSPQPAYDLQRYQPPPFSNGPPSIQPYGPTTTHMTPLTFAGPSQPRFVDMPMRIPELTSCGRNRSASDASHESYNTDNSRSRSPTFAEMSRYGRQNLDGTWSCISNGCTSRTTFTRGCDLRKHYKRHTKSLYCRHQGCPQATSNGFSSNKDRQRHEQKHNPEVRCEWQGCPKIFSRHDNMKDHVKRVHLK